MATRLAHSRVHYGVRFSLQLRSLSSLASEDANPVVEPVYPAVTTDPVYTTDLTIERLFQARVHLGHKHGVWNPLMKPFLIGRRCGLDIFDLPTTLKHFQLALMVTANIVKRKGIILFVNGRTQFDRLIRDTVEDCGEYVCSPTWRPGTLTNSHMLLKTARLPDLMIFLNVGPSATAAREAATCSIPSIGIVDSDSDPRLLTYCIPGNDDSPSSVKLYCKLFSDVIKNVKQNS